MQDGEIHRWATVVQNIRNAGRELPDTVRNWMQAIHAWRPRS